MLSAELELHHLDARQWKNWWTLLTPPPLQRRPRWALVVLDQGAVHKLIIRGEGEQPPAALPGLPRPTPRALADYARMLGVSAVVVVERRLLAQLAADLEPALRAHNDLAAQGLLALRALKKHAGDGLWTEPPLLDVLPAPSFEAVQRTFDLLVPDKTTLVGYIVEDDRSKVHASVIAAKDHGDLVRVATHRAIDDLIAERDLARSWSTSYRRVLSAVEQRYSAPSIALFTERATLMRIISGPSDQLARELNAKRVIVDPAPAWLLGLLSSAAVAAVAGRAASALAGLLPQSTRDRASALASRAREAIRESPASPFALLGFDPIELWSRIQLYYK